MGYRLQKLKQISTKIRNKQRKEGREGRRKEAKGKNRKEKKVEKGRSLGINDFRYNRIQKCKINHWGLLTVYLYSLLSQYWLHAQADSPSSCDSKDGPWPLQTYMPFPANDFCQESCGLGDRKCGLGEGFIFSASLRKYFRAGSENLAWIMCLTLNQSLWPKDHRSTLGAGK